MGDVSVSVSTQQVTLEKEPASVAVSVTNGSAAVQRVVLTVLGPPLPGPGSGGGLAAPPGGGTWAVIERPLREIGPGATEQYVAQIAPEAAPPGSHPVTFVAYPADRAPEEYRDRGQTVQVVVPSAAVQSPRRPRWWLVAAAVALVVALGAVAFALTRPSTLIVPGVVGESLADAQAILDAAGLVVEAETEVGPEPLDTVVRQDPEEGAEAETGSTVLVVVQVGVELPDVVGSPVAEASSTLEDLGVSVQATTEESDASPGTVLGMDPPAGTEVGVGSVVDIVVATPRLVPVPEVGGMSADRARVVLEASGLFVQVIESPVCQLPFGGRCRVVAQDPPPGTRVPRGSLVTVATGD